jgi:hypothetical protein
MGGKILEEQEVRWVVTAFFVALFSCVPPIEACRLLESFKMILDEEGTIRGH